MLFGLVQAAEVAELRSTATFGAWERSFGDGNKIEGAFPHIRQAGTWQAA